MQAEMREAIEDLLDVSHGSCLLRDQRAARIVVDCLLRFDGDRYDLISWCVMPNHVHILVHLREGWTLSKIVQNWKTISSKQIGLLFGFTGRLWQPEYFDRLMRDDDHLRRTIQYIENNPVKARLCVAADEYPFSSAARI
jgi:REP element-mobilizing transposase RayT